MHARAAANLAAVSRALASWQATTNLFALEQCYHALSTLRRDAARWPHVMAALPALTDTTPALHTLTRCMSSHKDTTGDAALMPSVQSLATPAFFPLYAFACEHLTGTAAQAAYLLTWPQLVARGMPSFDALNPLAQRWICDWYQRLGAPLPLYVGATVGCSTAVMNSTTVHSSNIVYRFAKPYRTLLTCHGTQPLADATVTDLPCGNQPRSLMVLFNINHLSPSRLLWYGSTAAVKRMCSLAIDHACRFYFWGYGIDVVAPAAPVLSEWHSLAATFDGNRLIFFYDGTPVASYSGTLNTDFSPVYLGGNFHGTIADAIIWRRALSEDEMRTVVTHSMRALTMKMMPWQAASPLAAP